jgi:hypothetical protein
LKTQKNSDHVALSSSLRRGPAAGGARAIRSFRQHPLNPGKPRSRLNATGEVVVVFRPAGDCPDFACPAELAVAVPFSRSIRRRCR